MQVRVRITGCSGAVLCRYQCMSKWTKPECENLTCSTHIPDNATARNFPVDCKGVLTDTHTLNINDLCLLTLLAGKSFTFI